MERNLELELVRRLRSADASAFDEVHSAFNTRLYNFLVRLSRNREVAEDLLEETWLRLVSRVELLREDTRLGPWLFTVARNLYMTHYRARALEESHLSSGLGLWPTSPARSPFEETAASEFERRVEAAIAELPVVYREILLLIGVEGVPPPEAAEICGISPEALRQRLSRARAALASKLERTGLQRAVLREVNS